MLQSLLAVPLALAQSDSASVLGTLRDAQGRSIADVAVTVKQVDTGFTRSASSDAEGRYRITAIPTGRYELTAGHAGFRTVVRDGIILVLGAEAVIDVELPIAGVTERLIVTADVPIVETTTSAIGMRLNRDQLDILPLFGRDYLSLLRLTPASQDFGSSFTGSRSRSNEFTLDGVDNTSDISGFQRMGVALESIQEFQLLANNYKAEHGRASGGIINVLTRSGTNASSGSAFLAVSDDSFNSQSPYANRLIPEPPFHLTTFGGSAGGALVRDRWHYFAAYEGADQDSQAEATQVMPASTAAFSPATLAYLNANRIPLSIFGDGGQVRQVRPEYASLHNITARIDGALNPAQTLTTRYTFRRSEFRSGENGTLFDYNGNASLVRDHYVVATHKWMVGANRLNETYVQAGHTYSDFSVRYPALTNVFVSGSFSLGGNTGFPQGRTEPLVQVADNFTLIRSGGRTGDHTIKAGANVKVFRSDSVFDANVRGTFTFLSMQQFLSGQPTSFTQFRGDTRLDRPNTLSGFYIQDDWRPRPDLTVNAGLRYDYESAKTLALREISGAPGPGIGGDKNNVAPRVGLVWAPGGSTRHAIHAGAGIYYDQIVMNILGNIRFTPPKVVGIILSSPSFPDPTSGLLSTPAPAIQTIDPNLTTPYNVNSSVGYRRELAENLGLDVSYVYNRGWDQVMTVERNIGIPGTANVFGQGASRRNPAITSDTFSTNLGVIRYHGLLVDLHKRFANGVQGGVGYTLSKTRDNGANFASPIQVPTRPDLSDGPSFNDRRHELKAHLEVNLPFDIQWAGIVEHYAEAPLNVTATRDLNGDGILGDWVNEDLCLTIACPGFRYARNSVRELSTEEANRLRGLFGLAPITEFANNPKFLNVNMTLQKSVRFGGRRARITAEAFNVFNTPQRLIGSSSATSGIFGTYVSVVQPRALQFTMQFDW
ncbi:MAG TPA: TonB-dependent receptor [Vicinamibacterales bacterium]|nr:TonB-dependent receptor [Vicinamibacterales bacterium]